MIPVLDPMLCDRGLPAGDLSSWAAEPKLDGWRVVVAVDPDGSGVSVRTRRGHPVNVPDIESLAGLGHRLVLDGELVAGAGRASDFYAVLPRVAGQRPNGALSIWFFDVLWMDGDLLTGRAYRDRRAVLEGLGMPAPCGVLPRWPGSDVADLLVACVEFDVEGVVLKRLRSAYRCGERSRWWRTMCSGAPGCHRRHGGVRIPH